MLETVAWLALRIVFAWMFLYPAKALLEDWSGTVQTTGLLFARGSAFFAAASVAMMVGGGFAILFGVYGRLAGVGLCAFSVGGAMIHYRLAARVGELCLSDEASEADRAVGSEWVTLGTVGHVTSAQKNFVLAAVALFFALMGTGPASLG